MGLFARRDHRTAIAATPYRVSAQGPTRVNGCLKMRTSGPAQSAYAMLPSSRTQPDKRFPGGSLRDADVRAPPTVIHNALVVPRRPWVDAALRELIGNYHARRICYSMRFPSSMSWRSWTNLRTIIGDRNGWESHTAIWHALTPQASNQTGGPPIFVVSFCPEGKTENLGRTAKPA